MRRKSVLITGGSRGVGRAVALALAKPGYDFVINHRNSSEQAEETVAALHAVDAPAVAIQADVADDADCRRLVEESVKQYGGLDILINNAATTAFVPHEDMEAISQDLWDRIFAVNVRGPFQCARAAQPHLAASGAGQIINITSIAGISGNGSSIPYCASKAAMINMTQSLARAMAPTVRVNSVAPGFIDSQWTRAGLGDAFDVAEERNRKGSAMGQIARPEDVAEAVVSLLEGSKLVTGQTLVVDAGALLGA